MHRPERWTTVDQAQLEEANLRSLPPQEAAARSLRPITTALA
jgi:hypothetical protein